MSTHVGATGNRASLPGSLKWIEFRRSSSQLSAGEPSVQDAPTTGGDPPPCAYPLRAQRILLLLLVVLTDALALGAAFRAAYWIRFDMQITVAPEVVASADAYFALTALLISLWLLVFVSFRLYDVHASAGGPVETARAFNACTMAAMIVVVGSFLIPTFVVSRLWLISSWGLSFVFVSADRFVLRRLVRAARRRGYLLAPAAIVGTNAEAASLAAFLHDWRASGVRAVGYVSAGTRDAGSLVDLPVLGSVADIGSIIEQHGIEDVIVAITSLSRDQLLQLCEDLDAQPVQLRLSSGLYEMLTTRISVQTIGTVPLLSLQKNRLNRKEAATKALLETSLALFGLLFLSPALLALALAIKLESGGPVIYRRRVLGAGGRQFDAFKFRTMVTNGDDILRQHPGATQELSINHKLKNDPRITRVGRWLRKYSLDELPQLFNVLVGQMALVGPRMITVEEGEKYGRHRMNLLTVKPGITGLWQVSGRSDLTYEERVRIDMYYVRAYSIWLDLHILFIETLPAVLRGRGAY